MPTACISESAHERTPMLASCQHSVFGVSHTLLEISRVMAVKGMFRINTARHNRLAFERHGDHKHSRSLQACSGGCFTELDTAHLKGPVAHLGTGSTKFQVHEAVASFIRKAVCRWIGVPYK